MKDIEFTVSDVKDLMDAFNKNKLGSMELEQGSFKLRLDACGTAAVTASAPAAFVPATASAVAEVPAAEEASGNIVKSPIVGTFYASPAPDKDPFVKQGGKVKKGDVLFIIESMKLMNEVTSEYDGVVKEIFVQNGKAVEYGQPVLSIEPA